MFAATFDGFSSVTFDELGLRVHVSRSHRTAGVFRLVSVARGLHGESVGALMRKPEGWLEWQSCGNDPCPVEVFDVVRTMI